MCPVAVRTAPSTVTRATPNAFGSVRTTSSNVPAATVYDAASFVTNGLTVPTARMKSAASVSISHVCLDLRCSFVIFYVSGCPPESRTTQFLWDIWFLRTETCIPHSDIQ